MCSAASPPALRPDLRVGRLDCRPGSFATAFLIELLLAVLIFRAAHGITRSTVHHVQRPEGRDGSVPPLHTLPIHLEEPPSDAEPVLPGKGG